MTKLYEEFIRTDISDLKPFDKQPKGEFTVVISEKKKEKKRVYTSTTPRANSASLCEKKKKKIVQFKTEVHSNLCKWNYVPDNEKDIKKHLMRKKLQGGSKKQYTEFEEKQQKF